MRIGTSILFFLLHAVSLHAQEKKAISHRLRTVNVKGHRSWSNYNPSIQSIDSLTLRQYHQQNLRDLLQNHSNAVIKNYGISGLSTMSLRGSSAAQTNVVWNGLNLNNAATGITDLSLLPVALFDEVKVEYNSSRSVGGGLILNNLSGDQDKGIRLRCGIGYESLGNLSVVSAQRASLKKCLIENKVFVLHANNRFRYFNENLKYFSNNEHAHHFSSGFMNNIRLNLAKGRTFEIHNWYQMTYRELPATLYEWSSVKNERIATLRSNLIFSTNGKEGSSTRTQLGLIFDRYQYQDSAVLIQTNLQSVQLPFNIERQWVLRKNMHLGVQVIGQYAELLHEENASVLRAGVRVQADYILPGLLEWKNYVQKEWSTPFTLPLIYGTSFTVKLYKGFYVFTNANKQYRAPTLNELYYRPGGNIHLLPESSDNLEGGLRYQLKGRDVKMESHVCAYMRNVNQWIVWYGNSIFTPHNVWKVWSRGVEWNASAEKLIKAVSTREDLQHKDLLLNASFFYSYNLATTLQSEMVGDYSVGKQLPYMPRYQFKYSLKAGTKNFFIQYYRTYTGYRFTTTDESEYLAPYSLHSVAVMQKISLFRTTLELYGTVDNVLNTAYQGMKGRMMPGRNGRVSVLIQL